MNLLPWNWEGAACVFGGTHTQIAGRRGQRDGAGDRLRNDRLEWGRQIELDGGEAREDPSKDLVLQIL